MSEPPQQHPDGERGGEQGPVIRDRRRLDPQTGQVAIAADVHPGQVVRLHARDEIADGTLAHGSDLIGQMARVPFIFLAVLSLGFVAMLVADADAAKHAFAVLRAVGATRAQLAARLAGGALRTAAWGVLFGLPAGALAGWLFSFRTARIWPGMPHYFVVPWGVIAEGTLGALVFVLAVAVPTALVLVGRGAPGTARPTA